MAADRNSPVSVLEFGRAILHDEARALDALADDLGEPFEKAVGLILECRGKLIVSGLGKSGHVARKIAATFASTGTTAVFLHLAEAIHGDLGMAAKGDVAILISQSGETTELDAVIEHFQHALIPIIGVTGHPGTMLADAATAALILPHWAEVGPESVAPTTSTTMTLALGDALAMTVMRQKGFTRTDFGRLHPGGSLGARLRPVRRLMHSGKSLPLTGESSSMHDTVVEMTAKRLGVIGVTDRNGHLVGVITDGDLRRNIERGLDHQAGEFMTRDPKTIGPDDLLDDALTLFDEYKITSLFVVVSGVFVTTDDERIADACAILGVGVIMTSPDCRNGTERCAEALESLHDPDLVINFQGDALLTPPAFVDALIARMRKDQGALVATPAMRLRSEEVRALQAEETAGRVGGTTVVSDAQGRALYFSKRLIPHLPEGALDGALSPVRLHVGIYAYRPGALERYVATPATELETLEGLEQLRFLVAGVPVAVVDVQTPPYALRELNNPEDVAPIEQALAQAGIE
jgi:KpsF/GutQ family protein